MKVLGWILAFIFFGISVYLYFHEDIEYINQVEYKTVEIENPVNEKLILKAEILYTLSEKRQAKVDSLMAEIDKLQMDKEDNEIEIQDLEALVTYTENQLDSIASADFKIDNYEGQILFKYNEKKFELNYKKMYDVYLQERRKSFSFIFSCYAIKQKDWGVELGGSIGFPKIFKNLNFGIRGNSFGGFGAGLDYKL